MKKAMNAVTKAALELIQSPDWFALLRGALMRTGLSPDEAVFGVGAFLAMVSRYRPNPLRVAINEKTAGSAKYFVRCVKQLLHPQTVCGVCSERHWLRFAKHPNHRVVYVQKWDETHEGIRFETNGNQIARISERMCDGRTIETPEIVDGRFTCFSEEFPWESPDKLRWLTIQLPAPASSSTGLTPLSDDELATWREVQHLLRERAKRTIVLPDWADTVVEQKCDGRGSRYLPVFLRAWQTMALLRSFAGNKSAGDAGDQQIIHADFDDLAITSLLVRKVFREGCWLPSPSKIFAQVFPGGPEHGVINPLTGKGVRYSQRTQKSNQLNFYSLLGGGG